MTAKIKADATGTKVIFGTAAEDALQIDSVAKTIAAIAPYLLLADAVFVPGANGGALKFSDGALIHYGNNSMTITWTSGATLAYGSFGGMSDFVVPFIAAPFVIGWANETAPATIGAYVSNLTVTNSKVTSGYVNSPNQGTSGSGTLSIGVLAIGRWK